MLPPKAYFFIGLNAVRALSILTLLLVFSSTIVVMVGDIAAIKKGTTGMPPSDTKVSINGTDYYYDCDYLENSTVPMQPGGSMFAIINHLFIIFQCILLILSEIGWPSAFFDNFIPVLGAQHGVGILGFMEIFIGAAVLSHHVGTFALVSAFFLFAVGILNVLLGLTFRASIKTRRSIVSWKDRVPSLPRSTADFNAASAKAGVFGAAGSIFTNVTGMSEKAAPLQAQNSGSYGFGRQGEKHAGLKGFLISKPVESLPRYMPKPGPSRSNSQSTRDSRSSSPIPIQDPPAPNRI